MKALNLIELASIGDLKSVFKKVINYYVSSLLVLKSIYWKYWYARVFICLTFIILATGVLLSEI